ncbi:MAG: methyltransferase domain-containing protein [Rhodospirillaceae bacterium]|nr:methyltransferase domain-containing protein [Rhodospirillaceae bacterium]MBT5667707.1 methyltransferase domain-containing protein [Rhodospirillaceae bacterium]MBT5812055.1 methyltransferase domain-containing protein [Rhodospirillaceae bacterium]
MTVDGVLGRDYHERRKSRLSHRYRLQRRTQEVLDAIRNHPPSSLEVVVDVGAADGEMIASLRPHLDPDVFFLALDLSLPLLQVIDSDTAAAQADAAVLPVADQSVDILIATAVIEHVANPRQFAAEARRVLRPGGLALMTTPTPLMEKIATRIGLLDDDQHNETFNLDALSALFAGHDFDILDAYRFMLSPVGMPGEIFFERCFRAIGLSGLMANQFVAARRRES